MTDYRTKAVLASIFMAAALAHAGVTETANQLSHEMMIVDTHIDVPYRINEHWEDVTKATAKGDFDYPRAFAGGLNTPFMSIFTPSKMEKEGGSFQLANQLIDGVEALVARSPGHFMMVSDPDAAQAAMAAGKIGLAMGMENGTPIEGKLENLAYFRERGISYITLTHALANHIADSSYDPERPNGGLSEFGKQVVGEMNRQGIMVDISHVSDDAFWQALEISSVPLIASHSSARVFTPGFERNMTNEMIKALAAKGGVIMINFGSAFLSAPALAWSMEYRAIEEQWREASGVEEDSPEAAEYQLAYREEHPFPFATMDDVMANFAHVIEIAGIDAVGIGSDFDGVGDSLPVGLKDVSAYPNLVAAFLEAGISEADVGKILGGNLMRVWAEVVAAAE